MSGKLKQEIIDVCVRQSFAKAADIDAIFASQDGFYTWYNKRLSEKAPFSNRRSITITDGKRASFDGFWDSIPEIFGQSTITAIEFCAVTCLCIRETSGNFSASPEESASKDFSYAFQYNNRPDLGNRTAFDLFQDVDYVDAHKAKAGYDQVIRDGIDSAWGGEEWPDSFETAPAKNENGFIMQADFYKFRGRGVIQTTGRENYQKIIEFILKKPDKLKKSRELSAAWATFPILNKTRQDVDVIASRSTDDDWNIAFSDGAILAKALYLHSNAHGDYLALAHDADTLNGDEATPHSMYFMAAKINSGVDYHNDIVSKIVAMAEEFASLVSPSV